MAESVDALVSNTSGATRAGSTPALGTKLKSEVLQVYRLQHFLLTVPRLAQVLGITDKSQYKAKIK